MIPEYELKIFQDGYSEQDIRSLLAECKTEHDLKTLLGKDIFGFLIKHSANGHLTGEHLLKGLDMVDYFGNLSFMPGILGFHQTLRRAMKQPLNSEISPERQDQFFRDWYADLQLIADDLTELRSKISLRFFLSLDRNSERSIILFNTIPGIRTLNSCSGHQYTIRKYAFAHLDFLFDEERINREEMIAAFTQLQNHCDNQSATVKLNYYQTAIQVYLFHVPPPEWIQHNKVIPVRDLCRSTLQFLEEEFEYHPDFDCEEKFYADSIILTIEHLRAKMHELIAQPGEQEDPRVHKVFDHLFIYEKTYPDYYLSNEALEIVQNFWKHFEELGSEVRSQREVYML